MERPPEACPRPLATALQGSPRFQRLFNLSTPVLLWGGLLTPQLWDQLTQLRGPYSWRGLSREALASTLRLLNGSESAQLFPGAASASPEPRCRRCAVVANGGILRGSRQGRRIDAHDYVFRLNGAVITGFERDVGTKTSFYGFTVNTMKNSLIAYSAAGFTSVPQGPVRLGSPGFLSPGPWLWDGATEEGAVLGGRASLRAGPAVACSHRPALLSPQDLRYIFIPSGLRDYVMLRSAVLGVPVPSGHDKGDR